MYRLEYQSKLYLLCKNGIRCSLRVGKRESIKLQKFIPFNSSIFQINSTLYILGRISIESKTLSDFFSSDHTG